MLEHGTMLGRFVGEDAIIRGESDLGLLCSERVSIEDGAAEDFTQQIHRED
ncbi:MAG: hypothetical protein QOI57_2713 [Rubrobacteraceae bacterium]|jgi:hypothetical protein|nr:hypothetical protein [Rubrobacteraceae bacterium]